MNITFFLQYEHINNRARRCCSVVNSIIQCYWASWALFVSGVPLCLAAKNFNILSIFSVCFFCLLICHISLCCSFLFFVLHTVGNWSSGWIDLYRCGHCRSDRSARSCVNKASVCSHTCLHITFLSAFDFFTSHDLRALIHEISSLFPDITVWLHMHICTQTDTGLCLPSLKPVPSEAQSSARLLIPPTLFSSISATPNFSLLRLSWLLYVVCSPFVCISKFLNNSASLSLQVLVAFISFSETMLLVYLSYKVR